MTDVDLTEIVCIIDRSGSMARIRSDAIGGFNRFLADQKAMPGPASFTLALFDHRYDLVHDGIDIERAQPLDEGTYVPGGTTALLDAVGRAIDDVGERLEQTPAESQPSKVIVAILTDGRENSSTDYTFDRVFRMIADRREHAGWEFVFLAANQDAIQTAASLAIDGRNAMGFASTPEGIREAYGTMGSSIRRFRTTRRRRDASSDNRLTDSES